MIRVRTLTRQMMPIVALFFTAAAFGQGSQPTANIQPEADEALRQMGQLLAETEAFRFDAHITQDLPMSAGLKVQMYQHRSVIASRPGKIRVVSHGDLDMNTASFNDGALTVFDPLRGVYTQIDGPKDIDGILDHLALERGFVMPLADLLVSDPYASATERVKLGIYLGKHRVREHTCHHLAFRQEGVDWQIWIDAGEQPVPRKLLITFTQHAGQPQWSAELDSWDLSPEIDDSVFEFEPPKDTTAVEFDVFAGRAEQAAE